MVISVSWQPVKLSDKEYEEYLKSENIVDKYFALSHEIQHFSLPPPYAFMRVMIYLEWFFNKVIEKKIDDPIARGKLQDFTFIRKMDLLKDWELLVDDYYSDIDKLRIIRNEFAHTLLFDEDKVTQKFVELKRYGEEKYKELASMDKTIGIVMDTCGVLAQAIKTNFVYKPSRK